MTVTAPFLSPNSATVCYFSAGAADPIRRQRLEALLSMPEQSRAASLVDEQHRWTYVVAHALLQRCLQLVTGHLPSRFTEGVYGRPELADGSGHRRLRFNLTHTRGLVAVGLCLDHDIGIDAERIDRATDIHDLARHFLTPAEAAYVASSGDHEQSRFFDIWTVKEAVAKAVGLGLNLPFQGFSVGLEPVTVTFANLPDCCAGYWQIGRLALPDHRLAIAIRRDEVQGGDVAGPTPILFHQVSLDDLDRCFGGTRASG